MIIGIKDAAKHFGVIIISFCAVFVCTLFLNFSIDLPSVKDELTSPQALAFYDAQMMTCKVICAVSGGCLLITSIITLCFYTKHYIDIHRKNLGVLKALGYSNFKIASRFSIFGLSVLIGTGLGFSLSHAYMPTIYSAMNKDAFLPDVTPVFHWQLLLYMVVLPSLAFALLAVIYSFFKLRCPVLRLLNNTDNKKSKTKKVKEKSESNLPFLKDLKRSIIRSKKSLAFFIAFSAFCYSAMVQMSFSMYDLASEFAAVIIITIGLALSFTTLIIAVTTVVNSNTKTIALMLVTGYSYKDCRNSIISVYRPLSYFGFAVGTVYQHALLKIMVEIVYKDIANMPEYNFDIPMFFITLITFIVLYESITYIYSKRIKNISIKEIMLDNL